MTTDSREKECREVIEKIRDQYRDMKEKPRNGYRNAIKDLAAKLYAKNAHFIFELIQNAEDNSYANDVTPTLRFRLKQNNFDSKNKYLLLIENNEKGFKEKNVDSICDTGNSSKDKEQGYIGEKGIGFKSVFIVTNCPSIHSNGFHFELPIDDAETGLGYIVPAWKESASFVRFPTETTIILPLKALTSPETIKNALHDIAPETILFLSRLKVINIEVTLPDESYEIVIKKDDSRSSLVVLTHLIRQQEKETLESRQYWIYKHPFTKPPDIKEEERQNISTREVSVAIPLDDGHKHQGKLFAYLPVWEKTGLPFLINADFLLVSSRESIHEDKEWNLWLRSCITPVYTQAFMAIVGNKTQPFEHRALVYRSIPTQSHQQWLEPVVQEIQENLRKEACVLTSPAGALAKPEFCRLPSKVWRELLETPGRRPAALGNDFAFVHTDVTHEL